MEVLDCLQLPMRKRSGDLVVGPEEAPFRYWLDRIESQDLGQIVWASQDEVVTGLDVGYFEVIRIQNARMLRQRNETEGGHRQKRVASGNN